jgi:hypothetical protein
MRVFYERSQKRDELGLRFHAILHGAKFDDDKQPFKEPPTEGAPKGFMFGDPKEYNKMNPEEREELTQKMMGMHKRWAGRKTVPLGD